MRLATYMLLATFVISAGSSPAEVELSLNVRGTADEIAQVLHLIQSSGLGAGGGMKVQVESTFTRPDLASGTAPEAAPPAAPATPLGPTPPALLNPIVAPAVASPGKAALLTVEVLDPERKIDTVAVTLGDKVLSGDCYDNGMNGDVAAGDGRWSLLLSLPPKLVDGSYPVVFTAFDAQGAPVAHAGPDGTPMPLRAETAITLLHE